MNLLGTLETFGASRYLVFLSDIDMFKIAFYWVPVSAISKNLSSNSSGKTGI